MKVIDFKYEQERPLTRFHGASSLLPPSIEMRDMATKSATMPKVELTYLSRREAHYRSFL